MIRHLGFIFGLIFILSSCEGTDDQILKDAEANELSNYIKSNKITTLPNPSGLYYIHGKTGIGAKVETGTKVNFYYKGKLINGNVFDDNFVSKTYEVTIGTSSLISGLREGLLMMREGDTAQLIIPSGLAYGGTRNGPIPAYSTLIFEIEIVKVTNQ